MITYLGVNRKKNNAHGKVRK